MKNNNFSQLLNQNTKIKQLLIQTGSEVLLTSDRDIFKKNWQQTKYSLLFYEFKDGGYGVIFVNVEKQKVVLYYFKVKDEARDEQETNEFLKEINLKVNKISRWYSTNPNDDNKIAGFLSIASIEKILTSIANKEAPNYNSERQNDPVTNFLFDWEDWTDIEIVKDQERIKVEYDSIQKLSQRGISVEPVWDIRSFDSNTKNFSTPKFTIEKAEIVKMGNYPIKKETSDGKKYEICCVMVTFSKGKIQYSGMTTDYMNFSGLAEDNEERYYLYDESWFYFMANLGKEVEIPIRRWLNNPELYWALSDSVADQIKTERDKWHSLGYTSVEDLTQANKKLVDSGIKKTELKEYYQTKAVFSYSKPFKHVLPENWDRIKLDWNELAGKLAKSKIFTFTNGPAYGPQVDYEFDRWAILGYNDLRNFVDPDTILNVVKNTGLTYISTSSGSLGINGYIDLQTTWGKLEPFHFFRNSKVKINDIIELIKIKGKLLNSNGEIVSRAGYDLLQKYLGEEALTVTYPTNEKFSIEEFRRDRNSSSYNKEIIDKNVQLVNININEAPKNREELEKQLEDSKKLVKGLSEEKERLEKENKDKDKEIADLKKNSGNTNLQLQDKENEIIDLNNQISQNDIKYALLDIKKNNLEDKVDKLEQEAKDLNVENHDLTLKLDQIKIENDKLVGDAKDANANAAKTEVARQKLLGDYRKAAQELRELKTEKGSIAEAWAENFYGNHVDGIATREAVSRELIAEYGDQITMNDSIKDVSDSFAKIKTADSILTGVVFGLSLKQVKNVKTTGMKKVELERHANLLRSKIDQFSDIIDDLKTKDEGEIRKHPLFKENWLDKTKAGVIIKDAEEELQKIQDMIKNQTTRSFVEVPLKS